MNHITINKLKDLEQVILSSIFISGKQSDLDEEIYHNMWSITFNNDLIQKLSLKDLNNFISKLLHERHNQLIKINPKLEAIFYLWFDKQALQLRFNLISATNESLPFGCNINILESPKNILEDFIKITRKFAIEDDVIEFYDPKEDTNDENEESEYILDVYIKLIN